MFYRQKNQWQRWWFDKRARGVLDAPPVRLDEGGALAVLSQLQHKDLIMYLAAVKSFARHLPPAEVHVVDDGSLTTEDRELLARHIPGVHFHPMADCRQAGLPQGGCWERLTAIARLSRDRYVIQLDADTLTLDRIDEVRAAVRSGHAFSIGTWDGQVLESADERARAAQSRLGAAKPHIQLLAEAQFDRLERAGSLRYVRGCAGFSGFAPGEGKLELMGELSDQMRSLIGDRWLEWGSEQVMSNLVVANQPGAIVLPHPEYADCEKMRPGRTRFIHFIGTCRFAGGVYADMIRRMDWTSSD